MYYYLYFTLESTFLHNYWIRKKEVDAWVVIRVCKHWARWNDHIRIIVLLEAEKMKVLKKTQLKRSPRYICNIKS